MWKISSRISQIGIVIALTMAAPAFADEATEARLREALRSATEQVQELQQEKTSWQAQKALAPVAAPAR